LKAHNDCYDAETRRKLFQCDVPQGQGRPTTTTRTRRDGLRSIFPCPTFKQSHGSVARGVTPPPRLSVRDPLDHRANHTEGGAPISPQTAF
jgi:hypothetical protein